MVWILVTTKLKRETNKIAVFFISYNSTKANMQVPENLPETNFIMND